MAGKGKMTARRSKKRQGKKLVGRRKKEKKSPGGTLKL